MYKMDYALQHWDTLAGFLGVILSFFAGFKMRKVEVKKANHEALEQRYKAELQKLDNYQRAFEINSEMIESVKSDFLARIHSLSEYISQLEQMNKKLHGIIAKQQKDLDKYISKYGTDI